MKTKNTISFVRTLLLSCLLCSGVAAQTQPSPPAAPLPAPSPRKAKVYARTPRVVVENPVAAPQVVTILHRLNGLKVIRWFLRAEQEAAIAGLDENFKIDAEVHTNVIAGLALDDGRTIAAWLPEVGAEMPMPAIPRQGLPTPALPRQPVHPRVAPSAQEASKGVLVPLSIPSPPEDAFADSLLQPANLKIITRDGKRVSGHYVGVDGLTGLSVITLSNSGIPKTIEIDEGTIAVGQKIRLVGPEPVAQTEPGTRNATFVRVGEREAIVVTVKRSPGGHISQVKVKSTKLSPVNIGGIAIDESGETLGIVDGVAGNEATIVPVSMVRGAVNRVIERQASVPRPWLGIRGEAVESISLDRIMSLGWQLDRARALAEQRQGIFLTAVVPGSPAARAKLRPGDVILDVNDGAVKSAEDFTWVLQEAGPGSSVSFKIARPGKLAEEAMEIELGESPDPGFGLRQFVRKPKFVAPGSLMAQGVEGIPIKPPVASRLGATNGFLVVYVQPETAAFKAGLRPGDVIESIDGQQVVSGYAPTPVSTSASGSCTVNVVRNREKLVLTIETSKKKTAE